MNRTDLDRLVDDVVAIDALRERTANFAPAGERWWDAVSDLSEDLGDRGIDVTGFGRASASGRDLGGDLSAFMRDDQEDLLRDLAAEHGLEVVAINALRGARAEAGARGRAAAPYVDVVVQGDCRGRKKCKSVRGRALVDTGATSTVLTPEVVEKLRLKKVGSGRVAGIAGKKPIKLDRYAAEVSVPGVGSAPLFARGAFEKAQDYAGEPRRIALLGRDAMAGGDDPRGGMVVEYDAPTG